MKMVVKTQTKLIAVGRYKITVLCNCNILIWLGICVNIIFSLHIIINIRHVRV